jgi:hypothetical protein
MRSIPYSKTPSQLRRSSFFVLDIAEEQVDFNLLTGKAQRATIHLSYVIRSVICWKVLRVLIG